MVKVAIVQQSYVFNGKRWKSGEPAAETDNKEHTPFRIQQISSFWKAVKKANKKAACDIYEKSAERKIWSRMILDETGDEKPENTTYETTCSYN